MPRKKTSATQNNQEEETFIVVTTSNTELETDKGDPEISVDEMAEKLLIQAMKTYDYDKKQSSAFLNETGSYNSPTLDELGQLAEGAQDNLQKILRINSIINKAANIDDVIGLIIDSISTNLNDEYRLSYKNVDGRNKNKKAERAKEVIENFNDEVGIRRIIREQIPRTYMEGTVVMYLRRDSETWTVDTYPLGLVLLSPYKIANEPVVLMDITELKNRLQKVAPKSKTGKAIFFKDVDSEIHENFPTEVYENYKNKEPQAKLDIRYSGVVRIGNHGRKYGVSPVLRSLPCSIILDTFLKSDMLNAKARAKKMVVALLDPVLLGPNGEKNPLSQQAFVHKELLAAYKQPQVLFTAPAYVKDVKPIEMKGEMVGKDTIYYYLQKQMSTLGIGFSFLGTGTGAVTSASISLTQLMRTINSISSELEFVIEKFYRQVLIDEGLPPEYAPSIQIIDSEALEFELRAKLVELLYSKLNCSLQTALEALGYDSTEEIRRRKEENDAGVDLIMTPRKSQYTTGNDDNPAGRPSGEENNKQTYDEEYNKTREST